MGDSARPSQILFVAVAVSCTVAVGLAMLVAPWSGPVLVTLVPDHGLEATDLLPILVAAVAVTGVRRYPGSAWTTGRTRCAGTTRVAAVVVAVAIAGEGVLRLADVDRGSPVPYGLLGVAVLGSSALVACWLGGGPPSASVPDHTGNRAEPLARHSSVIVFVSALVAGTVVDLLVLPSGTVFGASLLAVMLALFSRLSRPWRVAFAALASVGLLSSVASLTDRAGVDVLMARDGGGAARAVALGSLTVLLVLAAGQSRSGGGPRAGVLSRRRVPVAPSRVVEEPTNPVAGGDVVGHDQAGQSQTDAGTARDRQCDAGSEEDHQLEAEPYRSGNREGRTT